MGAREWHRRHANEYGGSSAQLTPVVKWLLIANLSVWLLDEFVFRHALAQFGAFSIGTALFGGAVWEFITFQFLHGGFFHLFVNSIGLYFFGPWMERWLGAKKFTAFYLLCGVGGAMFFCLLTFLDVLPYGHLAALVGASAGIYGLIIGVAVIAPNAKARLLLPPITLTMRQLAIAVIVIAVVSILLKFGNEGGEAGHLGGAIVGFLLARFPGLLHWPLWKRSGSNIVRPKEFRRRTESKIRPRTKVLLHQDSAVDRVLDKISREGIQSLTPEERKLLQNASQNQSPDAFK